MNKLITRVIGVALGLTMAIGVGVAVSSRNTLKLDAEAGGTPSGSWTPITSASDIQEGVDYLLGYNNSGTDYFSKTTTLPSSNALQTTSTVSQAKIVRFVAVTGGYYIAINKSGTTTTYVGYGSSSTNLATTTTLGTATKFVWAPKTHASGDIYFSTNNDGRFLGAASAGASANIKGYATSNLGSYPRVTAYKAGTSSKTLSSITVSGTMTNTTYAIGDSWNPAGLVVTANYDNGSSAAVTSSENLTWSYSPATANSVSITSVTATASYTEGGVTKTGSKSQSVTVVSGCTYDLTKNWSTYAKDWGGYGPYSLKGSDVGASREAAISFTNASKQGGTITDRPVIAAKAETASTMLFVLDSSVSTTYTITSVSVAFQQWSTSKKVAAALYKGTTVSGTALDSFGETDTPRALTTSNLNGDSFIVDFTTSQTSNQQLGVSSISIGLSEKAAFTNLHHIKVTALPNTIYHVDEYFDPTGLQVTAYDSSDESTAAYKDVTASIDTLLDDTYQFAEGDVPGFDVDIDYTENNVTKSATYHVYVYAKAEYELVESEPSDWSGNYLLVASYTDDKSVTHKVAINSALVNFDQPLNFKEVTISNKKIVTGQECEFVFASYGNGYSMQGKNGKYAYGNSNNRFMTSDSQQELSLSFASNIATITAATGYVLRMNSSTVGAERFGFYNTGSADISLYKLVESDNADTYAQLFLETLSTGANHVCQYDESTQTVSTNLAQLKTAWKSLAGSYASDLNPTEKEEFRTGSASTAQGATNIQKALALYDHIARAYGTQLQDEQLTNFNFMGRTIQSSQMIRIGGAIMNESSTSTLILIVSMMGLAAVGGYFFLRKRKEQ